MSDTIDLSLLPESIRKKLEEPSDIDVPEGKRLVDKKQFDSDLQKAGSILPSRSVSVKKHPDPVEELNSPINKYERIFFTNSLLFETCGIDSSVSDRFRAETGSDIDSRVHPLKHSIVTMDGTDYYTRGTASMIQSVPVDRWLEYYSYVCSLNIVNRKDNVVWFFRKESVSILDPYIVDGNGSHGMPYHVTIYVFCPGTYEGFLVPKNGSMFSTCVDITYSKEYNKNLEDITKAILNGNK